MSETVFAVVVTHRRPDELAKSLDVLSTQTRLPDHLIVVDNDFSGEGPGSGRIRDLVAGQPVPTTYLASHRNLGGAGGFALGMLHALAQGADWVWLADDDGRPQDSAVLATLLACAEKHALAEVSPMVCNSEDPERLAFPLRRGLVWRRRASELRTEAGQDLLPGIASLFNGALFRATTLDAVGVPDLRLFIRGDEVEMHRRLVRSGLPFGTCLDTIYLHPANPTLWADSGWPDAHPIRTTPRSGFRPTGTAATCCRSPGWASCWCRMGRFGRFFLVTRRDPRGLREWIRLRGLGRREQFGKPGGFA